MKGWGTSLACPRCGLRRTQVLNTVRGPDGGVLRYRRCIDGHRFKTAERPVEGWSTTKHPGETWMDGAA